MSLPVADCAGHYLGNLAARDLMDSLAAAEDTCVVSLVSRPARVTAEESLGEVLRRLDLGAEALPVMGDDGTPIGWVSHREMLVALTNGQAHGR